MKEINFSDLPLDLKKQFIYFLSKNKVDFQQLGKSRFMHTKIRLVSDQGDAEVVVRRKDFSELAKKKKEISPYHRKCVEESWLNQREKKSKRKPHQDLIDMAESIKVTKDRSAEKKDSNLSPSQRKANSVRERNRRRRIVTRRILPDLNKKELDQILKDITKDLAVDNDDNFYKSLYKLKKEMGSEFMDFAQMRKLLREKPDKKKNKEKYVKKIRKGKELFPNKNIGSGDNSDIHFENDYMDKDYFYQHLAQRLGYSRAVVHKSNFFSKNV